MERQANELRALMVSIAHAAIASRAALDGHAPGAYDLDGDPEGYVVSLLNALHRWCVENGVDWEAELDRAGALFREDSEAMGTTETLRPPLTIDMMRCPACGHRDSFAIEVRAWAVVSLDGVVEFADQPPQSDDDSHCACPRCGKAGTVRDFVPSDGGNSHG